MTIDSTKLDNKELANSLAQYSMRLAFQYSHKVNFDELLNLKQEIKKIEQEIQSRRIVEKKG